MKCKWFSPSCSGFILTHLNSKYSPGFKQLDMGAAQYNHSVLLVDTGICPVQPQRSTGGHWELPSTTTVYWWILGTAQFNQSSTGGHWCVGYNWIRQKKTIY